MRAFLESPAVVVAPALIGWEVWSTVDDVRAGVVISETEAYTPDDPASHSFGGRTPRSATMFDPAGSLYVYRSYGIHWCMNVVTGPEGEGSAVLLRAGVPLAGTSEMARRRGRPDRLTDGPGNLARSMGVTGVHDGLDLLGGGPVRLVRRPSLPSTAAPRVGLSRAVDREWRWRATGSVTSPHS